MCKFHTILDYAVKTAALGGFFLSYERRKPYKNKECDEKIKNIYIDVWNKKITK